MKNSVSENDLTILIVDDDEAVRDSLSLYLKKSGWKTAVAATGEIALANVHNGIGDIVITDIRMPGINGLELTRKLLENNPDIEVLITTGHSTEELAINALKIGAFDYFRKPLNATEINAALQKTRRFHELKQENRCLKAAIGHQNRDGDRHQFIGISSAYKSVRKQIEQVAAVPDVTVLLTGETGVGKEVAARLIHRLSRPASAPFIALNCGGIPETLLEAELLGREKGAYTGADKIVPGIFEMAGNGTVLLDEISEMSMQAQCRFLRILEERRLRRLGGTREINIDKVRIIAATNRNLQILIDEQKFRQDLYYRIMVAPIVIPPLKERREDILLIATHFLDQLTVGLNKKFCFSKDAENALMHYDFPGNIRELKNCIERATIFNSGTMITAVDLGLQSNNHPGAPSVPYEIPEYYQTGINFPPNSYRLAAAEGELIMAALQAHPNNHSAAARALGITPQSLYRKIAKHKIG